ncbi:hypothetical protein [Amycolatopsis sp. NPDC050768]|uniref:hypothetical protein n=1 Tax=Amycolatopsis sp. NPDC050768 TaxID=3154839 RepID=UPI00340C8B74
MRHPRPPVVLSRGHDAADDPAADEQPQDADTDQLGHPVAHEPAEPAGPASRLRCAPRTRRRLLTVRLLRHSRLLHAGLLRAGLLHTRLLHSRLLHSRLWSFCLLLSRRDLLRPRRLLPAGANPLLLVLRRHVRVIPRTTSSSRTTDTGLRTLRRRILRQTTITGLLRRDLVTHLRLLRLKWERAACSPPRPRMTGISVRSLKLSCLNSSAIHR